MCRVQNLIRRLISVVHSEQSSVDGIGDLDIAFTVDGHPMEANVSVSPDNEELLFRDVTKFEFEFERWRISNNFTAFDIR